MGMKAINLFGFVCPEQVDMKLKYILNTGEEELNLHSLDNKLISLSILYLHISKEIIELASIEFKEIKRVLDR